MFAFFDWTLIIVTSVILTQVYKSIIFNRYSSIANFILLIEYIFLVLPILLNYIIGIPEYKTVYWYKTFIESMNSSKIAMIYDIYIGLSYFILYLYARNYDLKNNKEKEYKLTIVTTVFKSKFITVCAVISPVLYILISGKLKSFLMYSTTTARGLNENSFSVVMSMLILLSIYAFSTNFFSKTITKKSCILLIIYSIAIAWLQGKRFIVALMGLVYLFFYTRTDISVKTRRKLYYMMPLLFVLLMAFSYFYLVVVRPLSDNSFFSIYDMLRVDFGRDDVIKFVINQEFFLNKPLLDYPGETFISTILIFVPRAIWPAKPYPHYMYLTSRILNVAISQLPAGTTPSWFEMCLANCGVMGFIIGIIAIPVMCYGADRLKGVPAQMVILVLISVLITQSLDAYLSFLFIFMLQYVGRKMFRNKKIIIKLGIPLLDKFSSE